MLYGWPNKWPRPYATDGISPRNIETQCENIDVENQDTVITVYHIDGVFSLRKYFGLDVRTTDPLLNVVKWIAFFTEVPCFDISYMKDVFVTSFFTDWCNCHFCLASDHLARCFLHRFRRLHYRYGSI